MRHSLTLSLALSLASFAAITPASYAADPAPLPAAASAPARASCVVCAVMHGEAEAEPVRASSRWNERDYFFCSAKCKQAFDAEPAAFTATGDAEPAPDFSLRALDGRVRTLADSRGKLLYLDFWATWCVPCVRAMPELQRLHERFAARGLDVLAVSIDEDGERKVKKFVASKKATYPVALDSGTPATWERYRVKAVPASFLIDGEGRIVRRWLGRVDIAEVEAEVERRLATD